MMKWTWLICRVAVSVAAMASLMPATAHCTDRTEGMKTEALTIAFTETAFLGLNRTDVEAGYKALAQAVGQRRGYDIITRMQPFGSADDLEALLEDETCRMFAVNAWVFLDMDLSRLSPLFVGSAGPGIGRTYVLMTRRDSGLNTLMDLKGKDLTIFELANATLGRYWIEALVEESGSGPYSDFFARTDYAYRPSSAVLPVFFGSKQACVVDLTGLELMTEMNPQVGRELQVIAKSDELVDGVICLRNDSWPEGTFREELIETLRDFHMEPAGAQILTLFKTDRLYPFQEEYLTSVRALKAAHERFVSGRAIVSTGSQASD